MRDRLPPRPSDEALTRLERTAGQLAAGAVVATGTVIAGRVLAYTHDALDVVEEVQRAAERSGVSALDIALGLATGGIDLDDIETMNAEGNDDAEGAVIDIAPMRLPAPPPKLLAPPPSTAPPHTARMSHPPAKMGRAARAAPYRQGGGLADDDPSRW